MSNKLQPPNQLQPPNHWQTPAPIAEYEARLRPLLSPANLVEDHFVHQIAVNTVLAGFLEQHIIADPDLQNPQTTRHIRLLHTYQRLTTYAYEELRRHQLARHLQQHDPELAALPTDIVVATHTTRSGLRAKPRLLPPAPTTAPTVNAESPAPIGREQPPEPVAPAPRKTAEVGRNAQCPCNSGRKYKHCCLNKPQLPQAA